MYIAFGLVAIAVLMVIHESGHYFAARRFGMRVTKFSIGFGPTLWKHRPKGSPTTFQVAIIPFLAYVQIAGMNPYEDLDPKDPESYANASLWARIVTIASGPLANYLFASVFMFFGFLIEGKELDSMKVRVIPEGPAAAANLQTGDLLVAINDQHIDSWEQLIGIVGSHPNEKLDVEIARGDEHLHLFPTPNAKGKIMITTFVEYTPVTTREALTLAVVEPAKWVGRTMVGLARVVTGKEKAELSGPVGIVKDAAESARHGAGTALKWIGAFSAYLGAFNLLPVPALDGGRLLFLLFEATSRRRADAKVEAVVHGIGLLMFVTLLAFVTLHHDLGIGR